MDGGSPPGWYVDPHDGRYWRWWDGRQWSAHLAPIASPPVAGTPAPAGPFGTPDRPVSIGAGESSGPSSPDAPYRAWVQRAGAAPPASPWDALVRTHTVEHKAARWATTAVIVYGACEALGIIVVSVEAHRWSNYLHQVRVFFHQESIAARTPGSPLPPFPHAPSGPQAVLGLLVVAAQITFLVWQYRAATVARDLGYPARRSPALGVWSVLIPVVSLWFPYQSLRDCLPPGHPDRGLVLHGWLLLIGVAVINLPTTVALALDRPLGYLLALVLVGSAGLLARTGVRIVRAVDAVHAAALSAA